jgi:hypothetical protein
MPTTDRKPAYTAQQILDSIKGAGYVTFEGETPYDLNIFGIRSDSTVVNTFNDIVGCVWRDENLVWNCHSWTATTDPGLYWLENPSRVDGTAVLVPDQYRGVYKRDLHGGKYLAICQRNGPVNVWRDADRDGVIDPDKSEVYSGYFGINIHHASYSGTSTQVNKWSAGCQVIANIKDFERLMALSAKQIEHHPTWTAFTYTLLTEDQILPR